MRGRRGGGGAGQTAQQMVIRGRWVGGAMGKRRVECRRRRGTADHDGGVEVSCGELVGVWLVERGRERRLVEE